MLLRTLLILPFVFALSGAEAAKKPLLSADLKLTDDSLVLSFPTDENLGYRITGSRNLSEWELLADVSGSGETVTLPYPLSGLTLPYFFRVHTETPEPPPEPFDIQLVQTHAQNLDYARIRFRTTAAAFASVDWGLDPENLEHSAPFESDEALTDHLVGLYDLPLDTTIYYRARAVSPQGYEALGSVRSLTTPAVTLADKVTRHGITWTFDQPYPVGRFVNGDWWVVGPVQIVEIDPAPGRIPPEEDIADVIDFNQYQTTSLRANLRWKNGSMIVRVPNGWNAYTQAYDSRNMNYDATQRFMVGQTLGAGQSLVSSISHTPETGYPAQVLYHKIMWASEKTGARVLRTAAVLTCLDAVPAGDAFRPAYVEPAAGSAKEMFHAREIQWQKLHRLPMPTTSVLPTTERPLWSDYERYFERVWLDHICGHWADQRFVPSENQAYYGREYARLVGTASLMLHLDVPNAQKTTLLHRLLQLGIDLRGMALQGATWAEGGGLTSGRKWPILFAGLMLNEDYAYDLHEDAVFHEDAQTYWGRGWHNQRALYQMVYHTAPRLTFQEQTPDTYATWDTGGSLGGKSWGIRSEEYRSNTTVRAWPGQTLAALLMNAKSIWNHDAYFEVVDDWMRPVDLYADHRQGFPRPHPSTQPYPPVPGLDPALVSLWSYAFETTAYEAFVTQMWHTYRDSEAVPQQPHGDTHRKWNPFATGRARSDVRWAPNDRVRWEPNPMPTDIGPEALTAP
ncbi:MAG: hypothetical protein JJT96_18875 [Opitutales bacterium]|nr:hypothetical protein [Opitutales bacterium]